MAGHCVGDLLIGGNLGNRVENLAKASTLIGKRAGEVSRSSRIFETAAWGITDQKPFLNQALRITTLLTPHELLDVILGIEMTMGRIRLEKNGPRLIDIDILFYNGLIISEPRLTVPHPLLHERRFVLAPLNDIASAFVHPLLNKSVSTLLLECKDDLAAEPFTPALH
ncbi:MAG: 2-amino-4-hydroxy-6-hydroxymethyldihydropteridine diphosphokinase [Chitinophagaceae bacterium]|nr:MAG: 2-amino-4-hydroxy-6-hydroxymethyldihydropteridine diphosphokinase [Chitinophagaceae bacterium]